MIETAEEMKCLGRRKSQLPFQKGIIISSKSLLQLFETLSHKRNVKFIMTSHLNQDCVENLFSQIRALGGSNSHPTSVDFIHRLKKLIVGRASDLVVETASVEMAKSQCSDNPPEFSSQIPFKGIQEN